MNIRNYCENDWKALHALYNRVLYADRVTEEFFLEHLIFTPNFDPAGVFIAEENGAMKGAVVAQVFTRNISPWADQVTSAKDIGYLMPPLAEDEETGTLLLTEAEKYFKSKGKSLIRSTSLGPTLFPDAVSEQLYPLIARVLKKNGYVPGSTNYSMECRLFGFHASQETEEKRNALAAEGIAPKVCEYSDLPALRRFLEGGDLRVRMKNIADKLAAGELREVIIIRSAAEVLGFCQYNYYGEADRVGPFGVTSAMRRKGLGQVMVAKLLEVMAERGYLYAQFVSCSEQNTHFYGKNGFTVYRSKTVYTKAI